jgi:FlaG/FlaF family flagellin (archaellin)
MSSEERKEEEREEQAVPEQRQDSNSNLYWNKDVGETGRWGSRTKREILIVAGCITVMIAATVIGVALGSHKSGEAQLGVTRINPATGLRESAYTLPPPPALTTISDEQELSALQQAIAMDAVMNKFADQIQGTTADLAGNHEDPTQTPYVRAASWLVTVDTYNKEEAVVNRFALVSLYYAFNGIGWANQTNWLSETTPHCDWHGVFCCDALPAASQCAAKDAKTGKMRNRDPYYDVIEIDLFKNNLTGSIPESLGLFKEVQSIFLNHNEITGQIPTGVFRYLPMLDSLFLQLNKLTGNVPADIAGNQVICE